MIGYILIAVRCVLMGEGTAKSAYIFFLFIDSPAKFRAGFYK